MIAASQVMLIMQLYFSMLKIFIN